MIEESDESGTWGDAFRKQQSGDSRVSDPEVTQDLQAVTVQVHCPRCGVEASVQSDANLVRVRCMACDQQFSLAADDKDPPLGEKTFAQFELVSILGRGAFGAVYLARDTRLQRDVAIKLPRTGGVSQTQLQQFLSEAQSAARLDHPGIVSVLEVGWVNNQMFIVSQLIRGCTLSEWIPQKQRPMEQVASVAAMIARAVQHAHDRGIVHRDLKPSNILMDEDRHPKVTDFGIAKRIDNELTMTADGAVIGTPSYMSPEQASGRSGEVGPGADIYALGVILFQMATGGELPFRGTAHKVMMQTINEDPPSPRTMSAAVSRDIETIIFKCLEKEPNRRFASCGELADELDRVYRGEPILSRRISRSDRVLRWCKRHPAVASLSMAVVVSLLIGSIVSSLFAIDAYRQSRLADQRSIEAESQRERAETFLKRSDLDRRDAQHSAHSARAETSLIQNRLASAVKENLAAAKLQGNWSTGWQAKRIVDRWQFHHRLLTRIPCEQKPEIARLVSPDQLVYVAKSSDEQASAPEQAVAYCFSEQSVTAQIDLVTPWLHVDGDSSGNLFVVTEDSIMRLDGRTLETMASSPLADSGSTVWFVRACESGEKVLIFADDGRCTVFESESMRELGSEVLPIPKSPTSIAFSHTGKFVSWHVQTSSILWQVGSETRPQLDAKLPHYLAFAGDDRELMGVMYNASTSESFQIHQASVQDGALTKSRPIGTASNILVVSDVTDLDVLPGLKPDSKEVVIHFETTFSQFDTSELDHGFGVPYDDLVPHSQHTVTRLDQEGTTRRLVLHGDDAICVFQVKPRIDALRKHLEEPPRFHTSKENLVFSQDRLYTKDVRHPLLRRTFDDNGPAEQIKLKPPIADEGYRMTAVAIHVTTDGSAVAIAWHENDTDAYTGSDYRRWVFSLYALPAVGQSDGSELDPIAEFEPTEFGKQRRVGPQLRVSKDKRHLMFGYDHIADVNDQTQYFIYRWDGGEVVRQWDGGESMRFSHDLKWAARFDPSENERLEIFKANSTAPHFSLDRVALGGTVNRYAFKPDEQTLWVSTDAKMISVFDLETGAKLRQIESAIRPISFIPQEQEFLGTSQQSDGFINLVSARQSDGSITAFLQRGVPSYVKASVSVDGSFVGFLIGYDAATTRESISRDQTLRRLRTPHPASHFWSGGNSDVVRNRRLDEGFRNTEKMIDEFGIEILSELLARWKQTKPADVSVSLCDALARRRRWKDALNLYDHKPDLIDYRKAMLLYQAGDLKAYRSVRDQLLREVTQDTETHASFLISMAVTLEPVPEDLHDKLLICAENLRDSPEGYHRAEAVGCLYRLGKSLDESRQWMTDDFPKSVPPAKKTCFDYRSDPSEKNAAQLVAIFDPMRTSLQHEERQNEIMVYWHNTVASASWVRESERLLDRVSP